MLVGFHYVEKKVSIPKLHQTLFANTAMIILGVKFMQGLYDLTGVFLLITENIFVYTQESHNTPKEI